MDDLTPLQEIGTPTISDALEALGLQGATIGITPAWPFGKRVVGRAVTVGLTAAGETPPSSHLGVNAISGAKKGSVLVIDNGGRTDVSSFGGILATAASLNGLEGVVIDGACRDIDDYVGLDFPVFARGSVVATARRRVMELSTNKLVQLGGRQVRPDDVIVGDRSGVVVVPKEHLAAVISKSCELEAREQQMVADLRGGMDLAEVDAKYSYEQMLTTDANDDTHSTREDD
ncbi:RraA family protein [Cognatishimia maritima]|uniref:Putative 4-hydroxy-4-methyl-2-oxoglutarate aldolase n=1 Tax=Cognatishimia maritima TaxID=870908 RepID=A0A1M5W055_9RHOB|nr:dimethylmenaquinone methyltransferase [Cognatishimia maritima]SHH80553.1 Regulator of RNase E activity RraA [Cognatishimia maritima]